MTDNNLGTNELRMCACRTAVELLSVWAPNTCVVVPPFTLVTLDLKARSC